MSDEIVLREPRQIRALAHPLRLRILAYLQLEGPATATTMGTQFGESAALLSYHLRQLAKYGYVEEAHELGRTRKERPWRARAMGERLDRTMYDSPGVRPAAAALLAQFVEGATHIYLDFLDHFEEHPPEWQRAAVYQGRTINVTAAELEEIARRIADVVAPYGRPQPAERPPGAERVHVSIQAVPWRRV